MERKAKCYLSKLLVSLGISPQITGYRYIKEIVFLYIDVGTLRLIDTYPIIARNFNQTPKLVASSVRNALKRANNNDLNMKMDRLMGVNTFDKNYNITVGEFLGLISDYLKYHWDGSMDVPIA